MATSPVSYRDGGWKLLKLSSSNPLLVSLIETFATFEVRLEAVRGLTHLNNLALIANFRLVINHTFADNLVCQLLRNLYFVFVIRVFSHLRGVIFLGHPPRDKRSFVVEASCLSLR